MFHICLVTITIQICLVSVTIQKNIYPTPISLQKMMGGLSKNCPDRVFLLTLRVEYYVHVRGDSFFQFRGVGGRPRQPGRSPTGAAQAQPIESRHLSWGSERVCKRVFKNAVASYSAPSLGLNHAKLNCQVFQVSDVDRSCCTLLPILFGAVSMNECWVI